MKFILIAVIWANTMEISPPIHVYEVPTRAACVRKMHEVVELMRDFNIEFKCYQYQFEEDQPAT